MASITAIDFVFEMNSSLFQKWVGKLRTVLLPTLSSRMKAVRPSPTLRITARAKELTSEGVHVVGFGAGEPDFNTPDAICEAAMAALRSGETKYTPSAGTPKLRKAVAEKLERENHLTYDPQQIIVSCGAKHSVYNSLQVLIEPGDEVILIAPYWMTYRDQVVLADGQPVVIHTRSEQGFCPTEEQLRNAISPRTKAIIINSPSNPTGSVLPRETLSLIANLAVEHGFWIISDEIYEHLLYDRTHFGIAQLGKEVYDRTITITGCSKSYSMTGWRIGFAACPLEVAKAMSALQDQMTSNPTSFAQAGAVAALNLDPDIVEGMRLKFMRRRDRMVELLNAIPGINLQAPEGAFYVFPDLSHFLKDQDDCQLAENLLERAHVATVPGSVFEGDGHLRLSYATSEEQIEEGVSRISKFLSQIDS